jgi:outer membrane lipoprotein LolB
VKRRFAALVSVFFALFLIAGCETNKRAKDKNVTEYTNWHGRLAMQVEADPDEPLSHGQSFSASFELFGTPEAGELTLFTPLGSTAAAIRWTPDSATLESQGQTRMYSGLSPLIQNLFGTEVPVSALFGWLTGQDLSADGWQVNLTQFGQGRIIANRLSPLPQAQLRLILER